jgi:23S rRNA (adenine2503-C2)-methyltransferase
MLPEELAEWLAANGEKKFRAGQIFRWLTEGAADFAAMTDLSAALREKLGERFFLTPPTVLREQRSERDGTVKYLWRLADGNAVESVLMRYSYGDSACISTQVGCRMGCAFCASTIGGRVRNLAASEILDQVIFAQMDSGRQISNIVMMGIGEPLDNFDSVMRFLRLVNDENGLNIGMRHVSLSTCGLVESIDKLSDYNLQLTLSVSLHAPDDETRSRIMPVNRRYGVDAVLAACGRYFDRTGRRISYEYAMINGVNDTVRHAHLLAEKLKGTGSHVNLIPLNDVPESRLKPSTPEDMKRFIAILKQQGINVTVRRKLGPDIEASCGQLRRQTEKTGLV